MYNYNINQNRDFCIKNLTRDFFNAYAYFKSMKQKYKTEGVELTDFDRLLGSDSDSMPFSEGLLVRMRGLCPRIQRYEYKPENRRSMLMFSFIVNSLYYEMNKLREICKALEYSESTLSDITKSNSPRSFQECRCFFDVAMGDLLSSFKYLLTYIEEGAEQLWCILLTEKENNLLVRFLLEQLSCNSQKIWISHGGIKGLLCALFPEGLDQAYCFAAEGYFEGCWYGEARVAYEMALKLNPNSIQAKDGLHLLNKRLNELAELQEMERRSLERQVSPLKIVCRNKCSIIR